MKKVMVIAVAGAMLAGPLAGQALAGDREWAVAGKVLAGLLVLDAITTPCPPPTVVYAQPAYPPPVVYSPPVVYTPPVVYRPPVIVHPPVRTIVVPPRRPVPHHWVPPRPAHRPRPRHGTGFISRTGWRR